MSTIKVSDKNFVLILTDEQAASTLALLARLIYKESELEDVNAHYALGLGYNQVKDLTSYASLDMWTRNDLVVLAGDIATSVNTFLYSIRGNPDALRDLGVTEMDRPVLTNLWDEIHA